VLQLLKSDDLLRSLPHEVASPPGKPSSVLECRPVARVVTAVGNDVTRAGLRAVLAESPDLACVGEARNAREAIDLAGRLRPDLVLLGMDGPQTVVLELLSLLRKTSPASKVVIVSLSEDLELLLEAVKAGAAGWICQGASFADISRTISESLNGELAVDVRMAREAVRRLAGEPTRYVAAARTAPAHNPLSAREHQVLALLARGYSNRQIADCLMITPHTVKVHLEHIFAKMEVRGRTEAAVQAIEYGYISRPRVVALE
jgi:DNA-binding NarL/FixJ family response regulator